jgi:16S rRNA (guanine966-N2)-methyltransferase
MRIVAGEWGGRRIEAPKGRETRPTSDRVREALFGSLGSLLGPALAGARVLDAFAGTGALGLEALSRGASAATFVESDRAARAALTANATALAAGARANIVAGDAFKLAPLGGLPGGPFGLILLDPPYRIDTACVRQLLEDLVTGGALHEGAVVAWEHASDMDTSWPEGFDVRTEKRYGSTALDIAVMTQMGRQA